MISSSKTETTHTTYESGYSWQQIVKFALHHRKEIILAQVIILFVTLFSVPIPLFMPLLVDEVLLDQPATLVSIVNGLFPVSWQGPILTLIAITLFVLFLRLVTLILNVLQTRQFTIIAKDLIYRIREDLITRLQRVSMAEYESLGSGQVISHLITDLDTLDKFISESISQFLIAVLTILGTAVVLLWIHWQLALVILLINPLVIYVTMRLAGKVKRLKSKENEAYAQFQQTLTETLEAIQQIRAYNREKDYLNRVIKSANDIKNYAIAFTWKSDAANRLSFSVMAFGVEIFRAMSMFMVLFSDLSIGEMLAVFSYLWFMNMPMQKVINVQYGYQNAKVALQRINKLFALSWEPKYPHLCNPFKNRSTVSIKLEEVCFSYNQQDSLVLDQISLDIKAGEKVAFVGASGGGKTTLLQLLLGLYVPKSGMIYFDNEPVTQIGMDVVRDHVVTVLQHPALFNDTLRNNLTLGRELPEEQLWQALEIAQLSETVNNMENGLESLLGQRGVRLSGGQRQRVAVARMILANPKVVILDEATSALDTETESQLHTALNKYLKDKTTIIIAHRLSAVKQADRVFVFEDGRIIEQGHHDHLIEKNGLYAKLYGRQEH